MSNKSEEEYVAVTRALDSFKELFEKLLPLEIFITLKKRVESLIIQDEASQKMSLISIDSDRFLEYCSSIYQRFCLNYMNRLQMLFNAWTLYQENFMSAEEVYVTLKILGGRRQCVKFTTNNTTEEKSPAEIVSTIKEKLGPKFTIRLD